MSKAFMQTDITGGTSKDLREAITRALAVSKDYGYDPVDAVYCFVKERLAQDFTLGECRDLDLRELFEQIFSKK